MRYDTYQDTLQLNENMNKSLKFIESVNVLPHVQSDFIIFKMSVSQFTNYLVLYSLLFHKQVSLKFSTLQIQLHNSFDNFTRFSAIFVLSY